MSFLILKINQFLNLFRIPESKQHMVLPEIEEEADDPSGRRASKLSLTSLLLGKNLESHPVWTFPVLILKFQFQKR